MFQMLGVFAEFERAMIQEPDQGRVGSGVGGWEDVGETENVNRRTGYRRGHPEWPEHSQDS